jgi:thiol-disulfide isomerase/thioredoxin
MSVSSTSGPAVSSPAQRPIWSRRARFLLGLVATASLLAGACSTGDETATSDGSDPADGATAEVGSVLPVLSYETFDGEVTEIAVDDGVPLVINFWASWCVPCISEMPAFDQVHQQRGDAVDFLGINVSERAEAGRAMAEQTGVTYPLGRDPRGEVLRALGGINLPTTVVVAGDGTISAVHAGPLDASELETMIDDAGTGA